MYVKCLEGRGRGGRRGRGLFDDITRDRTRVIYKRLLWNHYKQLLCIKILYNTEHTAGGVFFISTCISILHNSLDEYTLHVYKLLRIIVL